MYPYLEFKNDLSERSQRSLQEQYDQAMTELTRNMPPRHKEAIEAYFDKLQKQGESGGR